MSRKQMPLVDSVQSALDKAGHGVQIHESGSALVASVGGEDEVVIYEKDGEFRAAPIRTIFRMKR